MYMYTHICMQLYIKKIGISSCGRQTITLLKAHDNDMIQKQKLSNPKINIMLLHTILHCPFSTIYNSPLIKHSCLNNGFNQAILSYLDNTMGNYGIYLKIFYIMAIRTRSVIDTP